MQLRLADALLRKILAAAIGFYRRRLSGRGPLRGVRCTFTHCESCSAYGERMVREAPTAMAALGRIRRRLQRCRRLSLYRLPDGGFGWGSGYDGLLDTATGLTLQRIDDLLAGEGESVAVRQAVRRAAAEVLLGSGTSPIHVRGHASDPRLLVRDATALARALARRIRRRTAWAGIAAVCGVVVWAVAFSILPAIPFLLGAFLLAASTLPGHRLRQRLERLEILDALEGPWANPEPLPATLQGDVAL